MFIDKNDRRRETWRWQDAPPDMGRKLGLDRDPMEFDRIFKMSFECFQHIVNWVVDEGNPSRNRSTPFQMWYKGARASSGTVSTVVGCGVLYLFSEASEMTDGNLLGVEPTTLHSYADMVVEEIFSRSSEVICFPPIDKQVCMRCSMMDAPFPVLSSRWIGCCACCQPRASTTCTSRHSHYHLTLPVRALLADDRHKTLH